MSKKSDKCGGKTQKLQRLRKGRQTLKKVTKTPGEATKLSKKTTKTLIKGFSFKILTQKNPNVVAGLAQLVEQAHIYKGICLNAEGPVFESNLDDFLHVFPPLSPLSYLAVRSIKG